MLIFIGFKFTDLDTFFSKKTNKKSEPIPVGKRFGFLRFGASVHNGLICNYSEFKTFEIPSEICAMVALVSLRTMLCVSDFNLMLNGLIIMVTA